MAQRDQNRTDAGDLEDAGQSATRARGEIAPRAGSTAGDSAPGASGMSTAATQGMAVDENRPVDVVASAGMNGIDAPRMQPNVLQRGYVIGDATHTAETTANQGPAGEAEWDEEDQQRTAAAASVDIRTFGDA